jgi:hypothetical protein
VGANFGATGTFGQDGGISFTNQSGDNGGNAQTATEFTNWLSQALPAYAASQGLQFNPQAAGLQLTAGGYANNGLFYAPTGYVASPEKWAMFRPGETYLSSVVGDLAARGVFTPQGTQNPELNYGAGISLQPPATDFQGVYDWQRNAIGAERTRNESLAAANNLARETLGDYYTPGTEYSPTATREDFLAIRQRLDAERQQNEPAANYAVGGVVQLPGGGKVARGPGGGLDDLIPTSIDGRRAAALSDGEFVIPADVVSMMGDGSSNAGSRRLYDMVRSIRDEKTGTTRQAGPIKVGDILKRIMQ